VSHRVTGGDPAPGGGPESDEEPAPPRSGDLLSEVLALVPDPVLLRRREDDVVLECNRAFAEMVGVAPEEVRGRSLEELGLRFPAEEREAFERRLEADGEVRDALLRVYRGEERLRHLVSSRQVLHRGEPCVISVSKDITDRPRLARRLEASRRRYRALFDRNVAGTFRTALDGTILECNRAFARMFGYAGPEEVEGRSVVELYPSPEERAARIVRLREEEELAGEELELRCRDGSPIWVLENSFLVEDGSDEPVNMGTLVDITDRKRLEERLERWAYRDALTGLANRRMLRSRAEGAIATADRVGMRVGLVFLDLVRFKRVNDTLGHGAGDDVLVMGARRLESCVREADLVARTGGDEFAAILTGLEDERALRRVAERFVECFEDPFRIDGSEIHLDLRMGMALYPDHASNFNELLSRAGHALREADVTAGLPAAIYEPVTGPGLEGELAREEQLRRALEEGELTLHYQPIVETATCALRGAEALVRWEHPEAGLLRAAEFVPLAERSGLVARLDRWVMRAAVRQLAAWEREDGDPALDPGGPVRGSSGRGNSGRGSPARESAPRAGPEWISVNLSAASLADPALDERVRGLLEEEGVPGERLAVEITERVALRDPDRVAETLEGLRRRGVRVAIDDFGTGRAVLAYLKQFAADILKLDMVFVQRVEESRRDEELVAGIAALGRQLGMEVLAEGVEGPGQFERLRSIEVDLVQGYHVGRPVPAVELNGGAFG